MFAGSFTILASLARRSNAARSREGITVREGVSQRNRRPRKVWEIYFLGAAAASANGSAVKIRRIHLNRKL